MKIFRNSGSPLGPVDVNTFVGSAQMKQLASADAGASVHIYRVEFASGGRTNWHRHSGPQWLLIVEGRVRVQRWGESAHDVETGDAVLFEPGDKHWHGASPGSQGTHFAVNVNAKTEWLEQVSDAEYGS